MAMPPTMWEAAHEELAHGYVFTAAAELQPRWQIPDKIAINVAVSGRSGAELEAGYPTDIEEYLDAASKVIEAGACGIHLDFTWVQDSKGRRIDLEVPPVEAYGMVLEPLRAMYGNRFVANLNVLNGKTFDECVSPASSGLAEVAPCAAGHPDAYMIPAVTALRDYGVSPEIVVHSSGEIELAKRKLLDPGLLAYPTNWIILFGLPFDCGRTLISGTWVSDAKSMATHLFLMVDQIRSLDPSASITVCNAGRANLYITTLATMMGLNIRVGVEDSTWKHPHSDERTTDNLELFTRAKDIAALLGRRLATADDYREQIGLARRS